MTEQDMKSCKLPPQLLVSWGEWIITLISKEDGLTKEGIKELLSIHKKLGFAFGGNKESLRPTHDI